MSIEILKFAVPMFLVLILLELWMNWRTKAGVYRFNDAYGSLVLGIVSRTSQLLFYTTGLALIAPLVSGFTLFNFDNGNIWHWIIAFVAYDLTYYWFHRCSHTYNFLWAGHVVHHQSEEFNLSTALRQSSSGILGWVFSIPLLLLGVPIEMLATCNALNLLYQFWVHTQLIDKLGWMESIMVTPSHHRVHHGQNPIYIDKNHGGVFIIWDRLFGTFQQELKDQPVIYGVSRASKTFNPVLANLQFWGWLFQDAWRTNSWKDKLTIWFKPTGWRPADVIELYPVEKRKLATFQKFDPATDTKTKIYGFLQLLLAIPLMGYFLIHFNGLSMALVWMGFAVITLPLVTTGMMLEGKGRRAEMLRLVAMWPLAALCWPLMSWTTVYIFGGYLFITSLIYMGFWTFETPENKVLPELEESV